MSKPSNKPDNDKQKISTVSNPIECKQKGCKEWALSLSQYCWKHMSEEEKANYIEKIEEHHKNEALEKFILKKAKLVGIRLVGANLSMANLRQADLSKAKLNGANLSRAIFYRTNLSSADLSRTNSFKAHFFRANLSGINLSGADLSNALLREADLSRAEINGANLSDAVFSDANLSRSYLTDTNISGARLLKVNLSKAVVRDADLSDAWLREVDLSGAELNGTNLTNAMIVEANLVDTILTWATLMDVRGLRMSCFAEKISDEEKKKPSTYQESYLFVKNYFLRMGLYDDASEAAYREKVLQRLSYLKDFWLEADIEYKKKSGWVKFFQRLKYIILNPYISLKTFFKILGSRIIDDLCGYGEKPKLTVRATLEIIGFFAIFYWLIGKFEQSLGFIDSLYFSVVTFTTLGLGDIKPLSTSLLTRIAVASEALIGAFMIALFVWTLARRGAAR